MVITGASGLLGLSRALAACAHAPVVMVLHARQVIVPGAQACRLDLSSATGLRDSLERERAEKVIHTVAPTNVESCERHLIWPVRLMSGSPRRWRRPVGT